MKTAVLIPAAGMGRRMENPIPKQLIELQSKPILIHTLEKFEACESVHAVFPVVPKDRRDEIRELLDQWGIQKVQQIVSGGKERTDSVYNGLQAIDPCTDIVLIHDAVRPFVSICKIKQVIRAASEHGAALLALPATATVKRVQDHIIRHTLDRTQIWLAQTPQGFRYDLIRQAYEKAIQTGIKATDDTALVEQLGHPVYVVPGEESNIKITTPTDLAIAEMFCQMR